jgi:hypothetical protein
MSTDCQAFKTFGDMTDLESSVGGRRGGNFTGAGTVESGEDGVFMREHYHHAERAAIDR